MNQASRLSDYRGESTGPNPVLRRCVRSNLVRLPQLYVGYKREQATRPGRTAKTQAFDYSSLIYDQYVSHKDMRGGVYAPGIGFHLQKGSLENLPTLRAQVYSVSTSIDI